MKKMFLLLAVMMFSLTPANAVNWVNVETDSETTLMFIDKDNIQYVKPDTCYYSMMYKKLDSNDARVSFIKSNYNVNSLGVIREDDYNINDYNPMYVYKSYKVFMKPVIENSFVSHAHKYVSCLYSDSKAAIAYCNNKIYVDEAILKDMNTVQSQNLMKKSIIDNWNLPSKGRNKVAEVLISVGEYGALNGYNIIQSTGKEIADRAIISAIELTAPFKNIQNINMKLVFRSKYKDKTVE